MHFTRSTSESIPFARSPHPGNLFCRPLIDKYRTCNSAAEISAMQECVLKELEDSYKESREAHGTLSHSPLYCYD